MASRKEGVVEVIRAAGGLLWRDGAGGKELLLIHRDRYDDWTLPKGKQDAGETLEVTAVREVREETGYEPTVEGFAGAVTYEVEGRPKVVSFWHMGVQGRGENEIDRSEVSEVVWLPLAEALARLQYPLERALVEAVASSAP